MPRALAPALAVVLFALPVAAPARAQWSRVTALPAADVYSVFATGDTIVAGADFIAWVSVDGGTTWTPTAQVGPALTTVEAVWFRSGRLWAGTSGQGVFTSDDRGATWQARSDGLAGGLFDSHLYDLDFEPRGDSLYVATGGAGVFVRPLKTPGPWQPTGGELVANQAGGIDEIAAHGARLLAAGGANGQAFRNDGGAPWTAMNLSNAGLLPNVTATAVAWTGSAWLVGTDHGFYRSPDGANPWTFVGLDLGSAFDSRVVAAAGRAFACVNRGSAAFRWTADDGANWRVLEDLPTYVYALELAGQNLLAGRTDGLWVRSLATVDVAPPVPSRAALAIRGAHPVTGNVARFAFRLDSAARLRLELFDAAGRRVDGAERDLPGGDHEWALDVSALPDGVYHARLSGAGRVEAVRFVRIRSARK